MLQRELGWRSYGGKHHESVYTRWYQGWFLPTRFGFDKRKAHLSSLICSGETSRDDALRELDRPPYPVEMQQADTEYVIKKFGLTADQFRAILAAPKRTFDDFPWYEKRRRSGPFLAAQRLYRFARYRLMGLGGSTE